MAIFIIMANVEYLFGIICMNFFVLICSAHIPNINANVNVNNTEFMPNVKPDSVVINAKTTIVLVLWDKILFVNFLYQFDFIVMVSVSDCFAFKI